MEINQSSAIVFIARIRFNSIEISRKDRQCANAQELNRQRLAAKSYSDCEKTRTRTIVEEQKLAFVLSRIISIGLLPLIETIGLLPRDNLHTEYCPVLNLLTFTMDQDGQFCYCQHSAALQNVIKDLEDQELLNEGYK